ncbi:valine--tRNA ligase [Ruminococcaceae bacterium OttesenSCG-928-A11]|nr:valine--tRNA ligase [Ruminococcaceae bacterium OttesenSCG-928-A11]
MKLSKTYTPSDVEANIYALWEASDAFCPTGKGKPFSIVMPPPNANGNLHAGHALFVTLEDILTRYHRMKGYDTIWIPGADHAGFETWVVFEKYLTEQGKSRFDYSRDDLYQMTWDFVANHRGNMEMQLRSLGASCDWKHNMFTLDRGVTDVVFTTFKKLWDDKLIYRGERIVNYCVQHDTSFADIEVEYKEDKGKLWYIKYPLADEEGSITVATTRPETMLGDEAIAVDPDDERFKKLIGKKVILPLVGKEIPIVADDVVEEQFGTGAVKVTPAHDQTDFEIGQRHNLPITSVIGTDGKMIAPSPDEFIGLTTEEAREAIVEQLAGQGLLEKTEDFVHQVPHCYKCGRVLQPLVKDQWFISVKPLTKRAIEAVKQGKVKFVPEQKAEELIRYYDELRDWNISRQIPWGIPIPAFHRADLTKSFDTSFPEAHSSDETSKHSVPAERSAETPPLGNVSQPSEKLASKDGNEAPEWIYDTRVSEKEIEIDGVKYIRDEDTFDTWFSSGQWPYIVTHVNPDGSKSDLERFYPTSAMETGFDIFRAWVARMIMLGLYISDEVPFKDVYLHGLVNDEHNQKMSKSKGNVINPMDIVNEYGADAMRLGIVANRSAAMSQAFSTATVVAGRNFCNKLWNIARYIENIDNNSSSSIPTIPDTSLADNWIFYRLNQAKEQIDKMLGEYRFAEAYEVLYHVVWDDVADWYIEATKLMNNREQLLAVLEYALKLAHPFAPFVTETIWQNIHDDVEKTTLLISQQWPDKIKTKKADFNTFEEIKKVVSEIRNIKAEIGQLKGSLAVPGDGLVVDNADLIKHLARLDEVVVDSSVFGIQLSNIDAKLVATEDEIKEFNDKLDIKLANLKTEILRLESRLDNKSYVKNAPKELVEETKSELAAKKDAFGQLSKNRI